MIGYWILPHLQATINIVTICCVVTGFYYIRKGEKEKHKLFMKLAIMASVLFLISYSIYHLKVGSVRFTGEGTVRTVYFTILFTHTVLAALLFPLVAVTAFLAIMERFDKHKWLVRITLPVWLYVSCTGLVVYIFIYHLYPPANLR